MGDITKIKVNGEPESSYQLYPRNEEFAKRSEGVQSDWNQNDSTAADYVKNRPFYMIERNILEPQTLEFVDMGNGMFGSYLDESISIGDGKVIVWWDGVEYECTNADGFFGNAQFIGGENTGEPFLFIYDVDVWFAAAYDTKTSHEVGIVGSEPVKINDKFIPNNYWSMGVPRPRYIQSIINRKQYDFLNNLPEEKDSIVVTSNITLTEWGEICATLVACPLINFGAYLGYVKNLLADGSNTMGYITTRDIYESSNGGCYIEFHVYQFIYDEEAMTITTTCTHYTKVNVPA